MSLPEFPSVNFTRDDVINQIISSIAMEELGLSHIINAEGEKLQYVLGTLPGQTLPTPPTIDELLQINQSVQSTLAAAMQNQLFLENKMKVALDSAVLTGSTGPTGSAGPTGPAGDPGLIPDYAAFMLLVDLPETNSSFYPAEVSKTTGGESMGTVLAAPSNGYFNIRFNCLNTQIELGIVINELYTLMVVTSEADTWTSLRVPVAAGDTITAGVSTRTPNITAFQWADNSAVVFIPSL